MTFDTSGFVGLTPDGRVPDDFMDGTAWTFSDLSPFVQGYVAGVIEAINFDIVQIALSVGAQEEPQPYGFSDLASETLERIMEDCERARNTYPGFTDDHAGGASLWIQRQVGLPSFPPLTPYLGEDGKVYLRENQG